MYLCENRMHTRTSNIQYIKENTRAAVNYPCTEHRNAGYTGTHIYRWRRNILPYIYIYIYACTVYTRKQIHIRSDTLSSINSMVI